MEKAIGFLIPIENDYVESPNIIYSEDLTSICFLTDDEKHGRITFDSLDSLKVSRGEYLPFEDNWKDDDPYYWIYRIENSKWLKERYQYEKEHYKNCYGFGGDVNEMLTDFNHYIFKFHDEFIEVITKGFWYEKDNKSFINRPLSNKHPFLKLSNKKNEIINIKGINCKVITNELSIEEIKKNSELCQQRLFEFYKEESKGEYSEIFTLSIFQRNQEITSCLSAPFRNEIYTEKGVMDMKKITPFLEKEL